MICWFGDKNQESPPVDSMPSMKVKRSSVRWRGEAVLLEKDARCWLIYVDFAIWNEE